jgi:hypothetical protein
LKKTGRQDWRKTTFILFSLGNKRQVDTKKQEDEKNVPLPFLWESDFLVGDDKTLNLVHQAGVNDK